MQSSSDQPSRSNEVKLGDPSPQEVKLNWKPNCPFQGTSTHDVKLIPREDASYQREEEEDSIPEGFELVDEWHEGDDDPQWMLETDYRQIGGGEDLINEPEPKVEDLYTIDPYHHQSYKRYQSGRVVCSVTFKETPKMDNFYDYAARVWEDILQKLFQKLSPTDKLGVSIHHPCLTDPVHIPLTPHKQLTGEKIAAKIAKVQQSRKELHYGEEMRAVFIYSKSVEGKGFKRDHRGSIKEVKERQAGHGGIFVTIKNADNSCCARAIVTAKALLDKDPKYTTIRDGDHGRKTLQKRLAASLMEQAGLKDRQDGCGFPEIQAMQKVLGPLYQIKVWNRFRDLIFKTNNSIKVLHLYLDNNHFDVIARIVAFHNSSYFCEVCNKAYKRVEDHLCDDKCPECHQSPACDLQQWIYCSVCNRNFRSQTCYNNHRQLKSDNNGHQSSICQRLQRCPKWIGDRQCGVLLKRDEIASHRCGFSKCPHCKEYALMEGHQCYMKPVEPADPDVQPTFIVFDLETQQSREYKQTDLGPMYLHEPNLCIAYRFCDLCREAVLNEKKFDCCTRCKQTRHTFDGPSTMENFGRWLYTENKASKKNPIIAIAHNARGFDAQFLINYLAERGYKPKITPKGQEIMQLEAGMVVVKDSLNFLPTSLAALPKTFGFDGEVKKGYFPHFFNTSANEDYEGVLPDHHFYGTSSMSEAARQKFFAWYTPLKESKYIFNLKKERWQYCDNDVYICAKAIMNFRQLVMEKTNVDPLRQAMTIASTTSIVYRQNFLPEKTIGLIPPGGYRRNQTQSNTALIWLKYISTTENIRIQHARNGGEKDIYIDGRHYRVDGYAEKDGVKTIYEFHGCIFHGCPRCFPKRNKRIPFKQKTMEDRYQDTIQRRKTLEAAGYQVIELWGCQLDGLRKKCPELDLYFQRTTIKPPMDPRWAFFGGRTNATKLLHIFRNGAKGHYGDVNSLYPATLMYDAFPIGHPIHITENFQRITKRDKPYKGLIFCTVVPPRKLLHPVLPYKSNGKTTFPLCRTCVDGQLRDECQHCDSDRELTWAWVHFELNKAVDLGYVVTQIHEVYHYEKWMQFDGKDPKTGLFTDYISVFLKLKQEKSGWPAWVKTEADQEQYIRNYEDHMGIKLDPQQIEKNAGLRAIAKLFLNSFWGKFGQRENMMQQKYVTPEEFFEMFHDETIKMYNWEMVATGDDDEDATMLLRYKKKDEFAQPLANTNVVLAAYVTAHARLRLYKFLEELQDRVLYFDTDSVFYISQPGDKNLPTGDYLGDLTDELAEYGEGSFVTEFVSAGPKNYSYKVYSTRDKKIHQVIKVKGHPLDFTAMKHINAKRMKQMVMAYVKSGCQSEVSVVTPRILRDGHHKLVTRLVRKVYRLVYDKRVVKPDYSTVPYGY
jgi:hypothetical protein